ncbi:unnamed protein product [Blepharisma stoltei]|uniref:PAS domain-containing protein n=1 Tax=Blepharisma stoltei TaxID=1481888 RepID=A0AAU9JHZ5_9CILI|nr:unnamed protein product [Blepharisma stoltei]
MLLYAFDRSVANRDINDPYATDRTESQVKFGIWGVLVSFSFILIFLAITILYVLFTADLCHSNCKRNIKARSNSSLDIAVVALHTIQCILYFATPKSHILNSEFILLLLSVSLIGVFWLQLPYYNFIGNIIVISKLSSYILMIFSLIFSNLINDARAALFCYIILQPILLLNIFRILKDRHNEIPDQSLIYTDQFDFELKSRHLLVDKNLEDKEIVVDLFNELYKTKRLIINKLAVVWEFYFCFHVMKDERLARVRLVKIPMVNNCLEGSVQEWKILRKLWMSRDDDLNDIKYIEYLLDIESAKVYDKELCMSLLVLLAEFVTRSPRIGKLTTIVTKATDMLCKVQSSYSRLIETYRNLEAFDIYISLSENILRHADEANLIKKKKSRFAELDLVLKYENSLNRFDDRVGIILISANPDSFGTLSYVNEKAAQYLRQPMQCLLGTDLSDFVPWPYNLNHKEIMKKFAASCKDSNAQISPIFFLLDGHNFLFECKIQMKYTALGYNAFFLVSIQVHNFSRELILLSSEGHILGFSSKVPSIFNSLDRRILNQANITQLVPHYFEIALNKPFFMLYGGHPLCVVKQNLVFKSTTLHLLFIVWDNDKIQQLKSGKSFEQTFKNNSRKRKVKEKSTTFLNEWKMREKRIEERIMDSKEFNKDYKEDLNTTTVLNSTNGDIQSKTVSLNPSSSSSTSSNIINAFALQLERAIKIFKWVLLCAIVAVISTNIAILATVYEIVSHTTTIRTFSDLGQISYYITTLADTVRSIDLDLRLNMFNLTNDVAVLTDDVDHLMSLQNTILDDYDDWKYCSSSEIVINKKIPLWIFDSKQKIEEYNLLDTVQLFINHCNNVLNAAATKGQYRSDLLFLITNSLGSAYDEINLSLKDLVDCEVNRIQDSGNKVRVLIICVIVLLGVVGIFLSISIIFVERKYEKFWEYARENAYNSYFRLKSAAIERLSNVHGLGSPDDENLKKLKKSERLNIKSGIFRRYSSRILIFIVIALSFYLLTLFYLYENCENSMKDRPRVLYSLIFTRALLSKVGLWVREVIHHTLFAQYPAAYQFPYPDLEFEIVINDLVRQVKDLRRSDFLKLMSDGLKDRIFEQSDVEKPILMYGSKSAIDAVILDSYSYSTTTYTISNQILSYYIANYSIVRDEVGVNYDMTDTDSKNKITEELVVFIYVTIVYSIILALIYLLYYLPFLSKEVRFLNKLKMLVSILIEK